MAGHYPLKEKDEPKLFKLVEDNMAGIVLAYYKVAAFKKVKIESADGKFEVMALPKDYGNDPYDVVVKFGKVSLVSITDEEDYLTQDIDVEVHIGVKNRHYYIKNIFWVA